MILGEHRVCGVGRTVVVEYDQLLFTTALDDLRRTSRELLLDLADDGQDKRRKQRENEDIELLGKLLKKIGQDGDLLDGLIDAHHELVVKLEDGVDLVLDLLELLGPFLRSSGLKLHVGHLGGGSVALQFVNFAGLILATEKTRWKGLEKLLEQTGVLILRVIDDALQLLNLRLSSFVIQLTHDRVEEVDTTKSSCHDGVDWMAGPLNSDLGITANMRKDVALA